MQVHKFGGASVKDAKAIINVGTIIQEKLNGSNLIVVSAMGKTTNLVEKLVRSYFDKEDYIPYFNQLKQQHLSVANELGIAQEYIDDLNELFVSVEWTLEEEPIDDYPYYYDQIVSVGELLSSKILTGYLLTIGVNAEFLDVRDILITDDSYMEAKVDWSRTEKNVEDKLKSKIDTTKFFVTQGFIGSTNENNTTTLGREGSDFTGAVFAYCCNAESLTIWKNVTGVMTGDPSVFDNVNLIERLSFTEAIEMTYYGAKVIHPKTIKPLQNKSIPLHVKSFIDPDTNGTVISQEQIMTYPPIIVLDKDQALIHISANDFSFVAESHLTQIFSTIAKHRLKVNLMRNTAISFSVCVTKQMDKIEHVIKDLSEEFKVVLESDLELITIRHYTDQVIDEMKKNKIVLFEEKLAKMIQLVVKDVPLMTRK